LKVGRGVFIAIECHVDTRSDKKYILRKNDGVAELAKASSDHTRDPGSNLSSDRKYFLILFVSHLNPNMKGVNP
jgi:hypothetical protein